MSVKAAAEALLEPDEAELVDGEFFEDDPGFAAWFCRNCGRDVLASQIYECAGDVELIAGLLRHSPCFVEGWSKGRTADSESVR